LPDAGRISNEKTHGVLRASQDLRPTAGFRRSCPSPPGQDTKADHGTTIGSREASDPDALRSGTRRLVTAPGGSRCLRTRSCASAAKRALRWCSPSRSGLPRRLRARPVAAERSRPTWRSLPQRPHERADDHGRYALTPLDIPLPVTGSRSRTATGGRKRLRAETRREAPRLGPAGSRAGSGMLRSSRASLQSHRTPAE
jgi:hypothetical protein